MHCQAAPLQFISPVIAFGPPRYLFLIYFHMHYGIVCHPLKGCNPKVLSRSYTLLVSSIRDDNGKSHTLICAIKAGTMHVVKK